jgi:ribosome-binding protein aMBF1 (putative translation factor)
MTPSRLRDVLTLLHWSQRGLADIMACDERLVRRMAAGAADIPPAVAEWLEKLAAVHEANPPPQDWRRRAA